MGIVINGIKIGGCNGVVMVNGQVVSGGGVFGNAKKFDEKKNSEADGIDRITVRSDCSDIIVVKNSSNSVSAHFYGEATVNSEPSFAISKNGKELSIILNIGSCIMSSGLTLEVSIPQRMFEVLTAVSKNGRVEVKDSVSARRMKLESHNGDVESEGNFAEISAITHNGSCEVYATAKNDLEIEAESHNGSVTVELHNIAECHLYTSTGNGTVRNRFRGTKGGYIANGSATSHNGNVVVR